MISDEDMKAIGDGEGWALMVTPIDSRYMATHGAVAWRFPSGGWRVSHAALWDLLVKHRVYLHPYASHTVWAAHCGSYEPSDYHTDPATALVKAIIASKT